MSEKAKEAEPVSVLLLVVILLALIAYRVLSPWTPFWIDISVGAVGLLWWLAEKASSPKDPVDDEKT